MVLVSICGIILLGVSIDDEESCTDFNGKWSLAYHEVAYLEDVEHNPVTDVNAVKIVAHYVNPDDAVVTMDLNSRGKHFFEGNVHGYDIAGTLFGNKISFEKVITSSNPTVYAVEGTLEDGCITIAYVEMYLGAEMHICKVGYAAFVQDVNKSVSPRSDWVDYNIPMTHVRTVLHKASDFYNGGDPAGQELTGSKMSFVKSDTVINIFELISGRGVGVQVIVSLGTDSKGNAYGIGAGNMITDQGRTIRPVSSSTFMSEGRFTMNQNLHVDGSPLMFMQYDFNVPYSDGSSSSPSHIGKDYKETVTVGTGDGAKDFHNLRRTFMTYDNVIYAHEEMDGVEYEWFGQINGEYLELFVHSSKLSGRIEGSIHKDGSITLSGLLMDSSGEYVAYHYKLTPLKD